MFLLYIYLFLKTYVGIVFTDFILKFKITGRVYVLSVYSKVKLNTIKRTFIQDLSQMLFKKEM